jgi:hypothetical protein
VLASSSRGGNPPFARAVAPSASTGAPPLAAGDEQEKHPTPWILLVVTDATERSAASSSWEEAGFGVEIVSSVQNALECLTVMTPALIVVDGKLYWPPPPPGAGRANFQG